MHPIPFESPRRALPVHIDSAACGCVPAEKARVEAARPGDPYGGVFFSGFKPLKLFVPGGGGWVIVALVSWVPYKAAAVGGRCTYEALFGGCGGAQLLGGRVWCGICRGKSRVDFDQVRKNCAEREMVCMLVSRFLKIPIQMNLSEKDFSHSKPLCLVLDPSGVGGYMRKRRFQKLKGNWSLRFLSLCGLV